VRQLTKGDHAARVDAVVRREASQLLAYFERRVEFQEEAADLLADTLLVVWRRSDVLPRDDEQARMWLYGVARNIVLGYRRGARRRSDLGERLRDEIAIQQLDMSELRSDLLQALDTLSGLDREIVILAAWDGFTQAEIAKHLRMRPATVRSRYSRARARLRKTLRETDTEADDYRSVVERISGGA
jgi:RNA polymerase sigma-70 factor (ECF subfamily)